MTQSLLHTYYKQRVKQVFNHLHDFDSCMSETDLHDFRVELKKMRSILKFLTKVYSKQKLKKSVRLLSNIFQQAGDIREYQILQNWLDKNGFVLIQAHCFPKERIREMVQQFQQQTHLFKLELKEVVDELSNFVKNTNSILAEQYASDLFAQINKMIAKDCDDTQWHELRKRIKQWQYACNWVDENEWHFDYAYFQKLQEAIGNWHDVENIQDQLQQKNKVFTSQIDVLMELTKAKQTLDKSIKLRKREVRELLSKKSISV